jgi:hypothetical protein
MGVLAVILIVMTPSIVVSYLPGPSGEIAVTMGWNTTGITPAANGVGWQTENNLGYTVTLQRGYLVTQRAGLLFCDHPHGPFSWLAMRPPVVRAHEEDLAGVVSRLWVEPLHEPVPRSYGQRTVNDPAYCQASVQVAPATSTADQLPDDLDLVGMSLYLEGTYQIGNSDEAPFVITNNGSHGLSTGLHRAADRNTLYEARIGQEVVQVTIERNLGAMFNGIDFANQPADQAGRTALRNVVGGTEAVLTDGDSRPTS